MVRCTSLSPPPPPPSVRAEPIESTSSMKMMLGACSRAITKSSRTCSHAFFLIPRPPGTHATQA